MIIYHNSKCSKSRCAIDFLTQKAIDFTVVEYLKNVPTKEELTTIIQQLGIKPEELVRKSETEYKEHYKGKTLTDEEWIAAMVKFPKLIERPIVINNEKAVIARPAERILDIL